VHARDRATSAELGRRLVPVCARMLGEAPVVIAAGPAGAWDGAELPPTVVVRPPEDLAPAAVRAVRDHTLVLLLCAGDLPRDLCHGADRVIFVGGAPAGHGRAPERHTREVTTAIDGDLVEEIGREVCGRRIGIALGSGGIRGWAHAGVFDVLAKENIPVDFVSGASAGALAGALYLAGMPATDMVDLPAVAFQVSIAGLRTYRPSLQAILSGRPFAEYLRMKLGRDSRIEDLPKPLVISTTDLDTREAVHLTKGPLPESIVASASVNGVFPPVHLDGRRLVDGGASDAVPVQVLRDLGADIVVAVNVMNIGRGAAGLYTSRFRIPMPGLLDTLMVGLDTVISQSAMKSCQLADIIIEPQAAAARWHEIIPAKKYARAGAEATTAALPQIRRLLGEEMSLAET
jgi:NTE family protein